MHSLKCLLLKVPSEDCKQRVPLSDGDLAGDAGRCRARPKMGSSREILRPAIYTLLLSHLGTRFLEMEFFVWEVLGQ